MHPLSTMIQKLDDIPDVAGLAIYEISGEILWLSGLFEDNKKIYINIRSIGPQLINLNIEQSFLHFEKGLILIKRKGDIVLATLFNNAEAKTIIEEQVTTLMEQLEKFDSSSLNNQQSKVRINSDKSMSSGQLSILQKCFTDIVGPAGKILFRDALRMISGDPDHLPESSIKSLRDLLNKSLQTEESRNDFNEKWDSILHS